MTHTHTPPDSPGREGDPRPDERRAPEERVHELEAKARSLDAINRLAASMLQPQTDVDDILWDVAQGFVAHLGLEDCVIYLFDERREFLVQRAAFGPKNPREREANQLLESRIAERTRELSEATQRSQQLLLNILPCSIVERLKRGEQAIAERFEDVTVLFAGLVDFTRWSALLPPEHVVEVLGQVFTEFDALTERHGLEKIKTIGDTYMVVAGVPAPRPDHREVMATMALGMLEAIRRLNQVLGTSLDARIGMHSGPVVAGIIGTRKFAYDLLGRHGEHGQPPRVSRGGRAHPRRRDDLAGAARALHLRAARRDRGREHRPREDVAPDGRAQMIIQMLGHGLKLWLYLLTALVVSGCAPPLPEGVLVIPDKRPKQGYEYALPGPLRTARSFNTAGPFRSHLEALRYACPVLMALPNAVAKQRTDVVRHGAFVEQRSWDDSTEYCAWIYQTPESTYELSWIGTNEVQSRSESRKCDLPRRVIDARYDTDPHLPSDRNITYVFAIHSHPVEGRLTKQDIGWIIKLGQELKDSFHSLGQFNLGIIAFFSRNEHDSRTCDGFFQYTVSLEELRGSSRKMQKWTMNASGAWRMEEVAIVHHEYPQEKDDLYIKIVDMEQR